MFIAIYSRSFIKCCIGAKLSRNGTDRTKHLLMSRDASNRKMQNIAKILTVGLGLNEYQRATMRSDFSFISFRYSIYFKFAFGLQTNDVARCSFYDIPDDGHSYNSSSSVDSFMSSSAPPGRMTRYRAAAADDDTSHVRTSNCHVDVVSSSLPDTTSFSSAGHDRQHAVTFADHPVSRPKVTGLTRSSSDRVTRPIHYGLPRNVTTSPSPQQLENTSDVGTKSSTPTSPFYPLHETTTTATVVDVPWWWTAAEKTVAAVSGRSSTLPRTVRDSAEKMSRLVATAGIPSDTVRITTESRAGGTKSDNNDDCMERRDKSMPDESRQFMTSPLSGLGAENVRVMRSPSDEGRRREVSALTVVSVDITGRQEGPEKQRQLKTKKSSMAGKPLVAVSPTTALSPKQLCGDAERLSNYHKVNDVSMAHARRSEPPPSVAPRSTEALSPSSRSTCSSTSTSAVGGRVENGGDPAPIKRTRERWLTSDGSSTEDVAGVGVDMPAPGKDKAQKHKSPTSGGLLAPSSSEKEYSTLR